MSSWPLWFSTTAIPAAVETDECAPKKMAFCSPVDNEYARVRFSLSATRTQSPSAKGTCHPERALACVNEKLSAQFPGSCIEHLEQIGALVIPHGGKAGLQRTGVSLISSLAAAASTLHSRTIRAVC